MIAKKALELLNDMELSEKYQGVQEYAEMLIVCKEALEKQIPKKITHEATLQRCATYPTCKNVLDEFIEFIPGQPKTRVTFTHCRFCGQALDWRDDND